MADLDYLDCQKANSLFCFRGWGWGQQYGIYKILMNGLWSAPPVTIGNGQPTIAKLTFLLRPKENQKKPYKAQFFTTTSQVSRHPETIHGSHQGLFGADGIQIVFESLELPWSVERPAQILREIMLSMFNPRFRRYLPYPMDPRRYKKASKW